MERELALFVEKKSKVVSEFIDLISIENSVSFRNLRRRFPGTIAYDTVQLFIYKINKSVNSI